MNNKITIKTIFNLILDKKPALIYGQIVTLIAILVSVPIPILLPVMVDEVLLNKPDVIIESINAIIGNTSAFGYILIVTFGVIFLRFVYYFLTVVLTKVFTKISKYVTYMVREKLINHLQKTSMNEYETLGSGAITANLVTDVNTLDAFIMTSVSKKLSNERFVNNAPEKVVAMEQKKLADAEAKIKILEEQLANLK